MDAVPLPVIEALLAWMQEEAVQSVTFHRAPDATDKLKVEARSYWVEQVQEAHAR